MSTIVISGDTSGTVSLTVPAVAGTNTATLPAGTGTVAVQGASTNIVSGTAVTAATGSPTSIDFSSIPSWVKRITVMFDGLSTNGTSNYLIQLGTVSSVETTSYNINAGYFYTGATATVASTNGFRILSGLAAGAQYGQLIINLLNSSTNTWVGTANFTDLNTSFFTAGTKSLASVLTKIRITTANGTDTFDAGTINILYE